MTASIHRGSGEKHGGQNQILKDHEIKAIDCFIRSLLTHGIPPTHQIIFNAIVSLKRAHDPTDVGPSRRWFRGWWKRSNLHKIKTKPLPMIRFEAAQESDVTKWFVDYKHALKTLNIRKRRNILNFDEAGFRIGCMKRHKILVPLDIKHHYGVSPENCKSATSIEMINAAGKYPPPPMVIILGQDLMVNWFSEDLPSGTHIIPSDSGFTSDKIAVEYLKHFIKNSDAGPNAEWKLMLMHNHGRHTTPEFVDLANENYSRP